MFPVGTFTPTHTRSFASSSALSVAWSPDGATAFMPDTLTDGSPALHLIHGLDVDPGQIVVSAPPAVVAAGAPVIVPGHLRTTDGTPPVGLSVAVSRSGPDGTHALPTLTTGAGGAFSLADTPPGGGGYTYRFTWPGDAAHPPATASGSVRVDGSPPAAVLPAPPAGPGSDRPLGVARFGSLVVDGMHGRLLASDPSAGIVAVLDLEGARLGTIGGLPGADGMTLSPDGTTLYVALSAAAAVAAIDTDLLVEVGRWSTLPFGLKPVEVAVAGGQLFFGYRWPACSRAGLGFPPPVGACRGAHLGPTSSGPSTWPRSSPRPRTRIFSTAGARHGIGLPDGRLDHAPRPCWPATRRPILEPGSQLSPDGIHLLRRGATSSTRRRWPLSRRPTTAAAPNTPYAGAYTTDGAYVAAAAELGGESFVRIWPRTGDAPRRTFTFPGHVPFKGVAFTPDSSRLYAVTTAMAGDDSDPVLHVRNQPLADPGSVPAGDLFHALPPARILDTRDGTGGIVGARRARRRRVDVQVTGRGGVPADRRRGGGAERHRHRAHGRRLPHRVPDRRRPAAGRPTSTSCPARPCPTWSWPRSGAGGKVSVYNHAGTTHVIFDVAGLVLGPAAAGGARYNAARPGPHPRHPRRHRRAASASARGASIDAAGHRRGRGAGHRRGRGRAQRHRHRADGRRLPHRLPHRHGPPAGRPTSTSPPARPCPTWSWPRWAPAARSASTTTPAPPTSIFDVAGWFGPRLGPPGRRVHRPRPGPHPRHPRRHRRRLRPPVGPAARRRCTVTGAGGVPAGGGVSAVVLNVTATQPTAAGYLTVFPAGRPARGSNLNFRRRPRPSPTWWWPRWAPTARSASTTTPAPPT